MRVKLMRNDLLLRFYRNRYFYRLYEQLAPQCSKLIVLCILSTWIALGHAQPLSPGHAAIKIDTPKEFRHVSIKKIIQGHNGFIWMATNSGLWRYDGNNLKRYQHQVGNEDSLSTDSLLSVLEDERGYIWILTQNQGISRFEPLSEEFIHFRHNVSDMNSLSTNNLLGMHIDQQGQLWIGSVNGINILDSVSFNIRRVGLDQQPLGENNGPFVFYAYPDRKGDIWMVEREHGFFHFDSQNQKLTNVIYRKDSPTSIAHGMPGMVFETSNGNLWVATHSAINLFDRANDSFKKVFPAVLDSMEPISFGIKTMAEGKNGDIIIGTSAVGLGILKKGANEFTLPNVLAHPYRDSIDIFNIQDIMTDEVGNIWVATRPSGLYKIPYNSSLFKFNLADKNNEKAFRSLLGLSDGTFLVALTDSLVKYDMRENKFETLLEGVGYISEMCRGEENDVFLNVSTKGLHIYNLETGQLTPVKKQGSNDVALKNIHNVQVMIYENNYVYVGLRGRSAGKVGLLAVDVRDGTVSRKSDDLTIIDLVMWRGKVLAGTSTKGVMMYDIESGQWKALTPEIENDFIYSMIEDHQGNIWLSVESLGLAKLDPENPKLDFISVADGLPSNNISAMTADASGNLWLATDKGFVMYSPKSRQLEHFDINDGLRGQGENAYWSLTDANDNVVFGNYTWMTAFNAQEVAATRTQKKPPGKILLSDFRLFNKPKTTNKIDPLSPLPKTINNLDEVTLKHDDSWFSLAFSSSDYGLGDRARYSYQMKGLNDKWIEADKNNQMVSFSSLPPKSYVLNIRSGIDGGEWHDNVRSLKINVLPPWWLTWQAYVVYIVLSLTLIIAVFRYRTRALTKRAEELEKGIEERTETINKLMAQKDRMFANISHEFKTPLTLILNPLDNICRSLGPVEFERKVSMMKRNSKRLLRMVDQLLELSKLETTEDKKRDHYSLKETLSVLLMSFQPLIDSKNMRLECDDYPDVILSLKPDSLEIILTNLLSNAIKYTPNDGHICVKVTEKHGKVYIAVSDSGIGIDEQSQAVIFNRFTRAEDTFGENIPGAGIGLALVKELVEGNDGTITLQSTLGEGSTFTVSLPVVVDVEYETQKVTGLSHSSQLEVDALHASTKVTVLTENLSIDDTKETILLIDDNVDMLELLQNTLMDKFNCLTAQNGEEGLALAIEHVPDLVISDVMMPGISGFEVVSQIKQNELTSHLPVILLTAKGDTESRIRGWDEKADEYLEKPFDSTELRMRIDNLLDIRKLLRQRYLREFSELNQRAAAKIETAVKANFVVCESEIKIEQESDSSSLNKVNQCFLEKIDDILEQHFHDEGLDVAFLAKELGISQRQLARKMKAMIDLSPVESIRSFRLKKAAEMLAEGHAPSVVAHQVGFSSHSYFSKCFKAQYDCLPSSFS